jgi:hypothetical protein
VDSCGYRLSRLACAAIRCRLRFLTDRRGVCSIPLERDAGAIVTVPSKQPVEAFFVKRPIPYITTIRCHEDLAEYCSTSARQIPLILRSRATSSACRFFWDYGGTGLCGQRRCGCLRCAMMRTSNDGLGRAERDNHGRRPRRNLATLRRMGVRVPNRKFVRHRQRRKLVGFECNFLG